MAGLLRAPALRPAVLVINITRREEALHHCVTDRRREKTGARGKIERSQAWRNQMKEVLPSPSLIPLLKGPGREGKVKCKV